MAMQLRSGRQLAASPVWRRRVRPRRSQHGDGKDRISSLPKEMCLEVLARLRGGTREAMSTSVLSKPWRLLWSELRELTFDDVADLDWLLSALAQVQPKLNRLCIEMSSKLGRASICSLLQAADKVEPLELVVTLCKHRDARCFLLPCFARATSIELHTPGMRLKLPRTGSFASLERLNLSGAGCIIDPGVLLPRCPCLRVLKMDGNCPRSRGVKALAVESSSLKELVWRLHDIKYQRVRVHVVAPNLEDFVFSTFSVSPKFTMSLSAPKLEKLLFEWFPDDYLVGSFENDRWRLGWLKLKLAMEMVPGIEMGSGSCGRQHILSLYIHNVQGLGFITAVERSIEQEVERRLPVTHTHFSVLELHLRTREHVYGALVLQLLRIRSDIQRLKIIILHGADGQQQCWEHCSCDFASIWRTELISLPRLEVAEFEGFRGRDHETDFLKLLLGSAPNLKRMTVRHDHKVKKVRKACKKLRNMFSANASSVKFSFS